MKLKQILQEAKGKRKPRFTNFDIKIDDVNYFSSDNADSIDKKLKTAKFKKESKDKVVKIIRTSENGSEDVTNLFID